jgi:hypothetical protein
MQIDRLEHLVMTVADIEKTRKRGKGERKCTRGKISG